MENYRNVRKYMALFGGWNCSVIYIDKALTIRVFGGEFVPFLEKIHQKPKKNIINSELFDVLPQFSSFQDKLQQVFASKKEEVVEEQFDFGGTKLWLKLRLRYWEDKNIPAIIILLSDKTEEHEAADKLKNVQEELEKKNLELEESNKSLDKFFSMVSHDLKTPLNGIYGFSNLLLTGTYTAEKQKEHLEVVFSCSMVAEKIITNLNEWNRIRTGKIRPNFSEFGIITNVTDAIKINHPKAKEKNINLISTVPNVSIFSDYHMISRILDNLLANAIKFTRTNGEILFSMEESEKEFTICVKDNGVGMDQDKIGRLFKIETAEFISTPGTEKESGTGFGLLLCKEFADQLGARLWCESTVDVGTSFFLAIPKKS